MTEPEFVRATRASYDEIAADYVTFVKAELDSKPLDRAMLAGFADLVRDAGGGPVTEVGCGPGRVTAHLHRLGLDIGGIDLSPEMIAQGRAAWPHLKLRVGNMLDLDLPDESQAGIVSYYSLIHIPRDRQPGVLASFRRALAPGGYLLLAFQAGEETFHQTQAAGHPVDLDFHRLQPDRLAEMLAAAGLDVRARLVREPDLEGDYKERTPQGFIIARRA
jgi:SAM-dependent methyltransferase